jgi:hypothetical protein
MIQCSLCAENAKPLLTCKKETEEKKYCPFEHFDFENLWHNNPKHVLFLQGFNFLLFPKNAVSALVLYNTF